MALYVKKRKYFKELRVVEVISLKNTQNDRIRTAILKTAFKNNCAIITLANKEVFPIRLFGKFGPKLTFKPITQDTSFIAKAQEITNWQYSLGDLELF